jgi:hypothetical protein
MPKVISNSDLQLLIENLRDLDYVSKQIENEYKLKNQIIKNGLSDNDKYKQIINSSAKSK